MPGLVDTHIHAPQYAFAGSNVDLPLLEWLNKYTFPTEQKFQSTDLAEEVYTRVVVSILCVLWVLHNVWSFTRPFISSYKHFSYKSVKGETDCATFIFKCSHKPLSLPPSQWQGENVSVMTLALV